MPVHRAITAREGAVLRALVARYGNAEIAEQLGVSKRTIETHVAALFRKYGVSTRRALIEAALADDRERAADEREHTADERERAADEREHTADERERAADEREHAADRGGIAGVQEAVALRARAGMAVERAMLLSARLDESARRIVEGRARAADTRARTAANAHRQQAEIDRQVALTIDRVEMDRDEHRYQALFDGAVIAEGSTIEAVLEQLHERDDLP